MCRMRLAETTECKNLPSAHHDRNLLGFIFITKASIDNTKNLLNSNISSTCPHNMVNYGPVTAEVGWRVWAPGQILNWFRALALLVH